MGKPIKSKARIVQSKVEMRARVKVTVGDTMHFPYNVAVAAGEPSSHKSFHAKYANQYCVVKGIRKVEERTPLRPLTYYVQFKVRFDDGAERELTSDSLVYVGKSKKPPKKEQKGGRPIA